MSTTTERTKKVHIGRNIKRFRDILAIKQEALAIELGEDWTQKKVSIMESKPSIDLQLLDKVAAALKIPADAIKNFDEEKTMFNIQHNYEGSNVGTGSGISSGGDATGNNACTFNPLDKLVEAMDQIKLLYEENKSLYERLLQTEKDLVKSEKEKVALLKGK